MAYYNTCPHCGCNLDPGEPCECREVEKQNIDQEAQYEQEPQTA